jgi:hypothetical protein
MRILGNGLRSWKKGGPRRPGGFALIADGREHGVLQSILRRLVERVRGRKRCRRDSERTMLGDEVLSG